MGKRKERRLVAKMGAGRRVKLDLFAKPSGEVGGSPAKDDDGKDEDNKLDQELPNSPSSSSQPRENPLSLLGQYSDDELDDASKEEATNSNDNKQVIRVLTVVFAARLPCSPLPWRLFWIICLTMITYVMLVSLKVMELQRHAA